jgi:hypothetical protein
LHLGGGDFFVFGSWALFCIWAAGPFLHLGCRAFFAFGRQGLFLLEEVAATSTKLGTVRYTRGRARAAPAAL